MVVLRGGRWAANPKPGRALQSPAFAYQGGGVQLNALHCYSPCGAFQIQSLRPLKRGVCPSCSRFLVGTPAEQPLASRPTLVSTTYGLHIPSSELYAIAPEIAPTGLGMLPMARFGSSCRVCDRR
jgi:hypothetical protein